MRKLPLVTYRSTVEIHGVYGQSVLELHEQIRRLLLQDTKDPTVAHFFAEPQVNSLRGEISWYTDADGPITPFSALSAADQEALWQQLQMIRDRIKTVGEKYAVRGGQTASTRIDTFRRMLSVANLEQTVFSVGGQPVICEWGCTSLGESARPADLWTIGSFREEVKPAAAAPVEERPTPPAPAPPEPKPRKPKPEEIKAEELPSEEPKVEEPGPVKPKSPPPPLHPPPPLKAPIPEPPRLVCPPPEPDPVREVHDTPLVMPPPVSRGFDWGLVTGWFWNLLKYLILFFLALLLLGALLRGCSASPAVVVSEDARKREESKLRAEIGQLRQQVGDPASQCPKPSQVPAPATSSGSTITQHVEREGRTLAGDLSIALQWNGTHDLDLYVREPSGQLTGMGIPPQRASTTGGHIDLDMNFASNPTSMSREPVEVAKWNASPPVGEYKLGVRLFRATPAEVPASQAIAYHLVVKSRGQTLAEKTGDIPLSADCKSISTDCKVSAITSFEFK